MKYLIVLAVIFCFGRAEKEMEIIGTDLKYVGFDLDNLELNLTKEFFDEFYEELENPNARSGGIIANVNDYADRILVNIQQLIIRSGLDPFELPDQVLKLFPTGKITLSEGWLQDVSSISRNNDVTVTYSSSTKNLEIVVPIKFDALMFTYHYHTKVLLLSISGGTEGKVSNVKANVVLSFNFDKYHASLDNFDIRDTGKISLKFTGHGLVDWITNTMTSVVTLFLHPLIIRIIEAIVKGGLEAAVATVNEAINNIFRHEAFNYL